jgi:hypothetical protein
MAVGHSDAVDLASAMEVVFARTAMDDRPGGQEQDRARTVPETGAAGICGSPYTQSGSASSSERLHHLVIASPCRGVARRSTKQVLT